MSAGMPGAMSAARPQLIRALNEQLLLGHIRDHGPCSRADLARLSGLSKPTVSLALATVEQAGLIREAGQVGTGTGATVADMPEQQPFVERANELGASSRHGPWHASRHDRHRHLRHQSCPNYYGRSTRQAERLSSLHRRRQENVGVATTTTNAGWRAGPQRTECRPAGGTG